MGTDGGHPGRPFSVDVDAATGRPKCAWNARVLVPLSCVVCVAFAVKVSEVGGWRYLSGWRLALKDESGPNAAPNELRAFWMQNRGR